MIKQERIIEKSNSRYIPYLIIALLCFFLVINILKNHNPLTPLTGNSGSVKERSWGASKRYYQIIHFLSDSGYIRCDKFLGKEKCNDRLSLMERRIPYHKGKFMDSNSKNLPYNTLKELSVNLNPEKKLPYMETVFTENNSPRLTANILYLLSISKRCENPVLEKWIFTERDDLPRNTSNYKRISLSPGNFLYSINDNSDKKERFLNVWKLLLRNERPEEKELFKLWCY